MKEYITEHVEKIPLRFFSEKKYYLLELRSRSEIYLNSILYLHLLFIRPVPYQFKVYMPKFYSDLQKED
jgi:hypothetical protein